VRFDVVTEFEQVLSANNILIDCWFNDDLNNISPGLLNPFNFGVRGTLTAYTRIIPTLGGVIGVAEEIHRNSFANEARAAFQLQIEGSLFDPTQGRDTFETIVLSGE
jgi:hypothetical protein